MARRKNGEGCIRRRSDNRWELRIMIGYRDDGRPKCKYFYGKTVKEVQEKLQAFKADQRNGIELDYKYTFIEWSEIWFEHHKSNISLTTQVGYRHILNRLQRWFGERYIIDIKPYDVEIFLKSARSEGLANSTIAQFRGMLYQIFHKAEANDLVRKNPIRFVEKMRSSGVPRQRKEAFTTEEVRILMAKLPYDRMGLSIRLMLGTGMRSQELLALEPHHIEEDGSVIHISQAVNLVKGTVYVGVPKSRDSYRDIPVPPNLRWCAKQLRQVDTKFIWEKRRKDMPCNPSAFRDEFRNTLAQIEGMRQLTPHSCRHTYVSQMQALGVDISTIQSIVGHADIDMTQHYLHVQEGIRQEAVRKFSEAFPFDEHGLEEGDSDVCHIIPFPQGPRNRSL